MQKLTLTPRRNTGSDRELIQALIQQEHPYPPCNQCDDIGWLIHDVPVGHADHGKAYPCECRINQNPEHQQLQLQNQSNLQHLLEVTFERTNPNGLDPNTVAQDKFRTAFQKAKAFAEEPRNWIAITGPSGSGKTQLAAAAANQCLNSNKQVYYAQTSEILNQIRSNIRDNPNQATSTLEQAKKADLLVLDDLRSDGASPWGRRPAAPATQPPVQRQTTYHTGHTGKPPRPGSPHTVPNQSTNRHRPASGPGQPHNPEVHPSSPLNAARQIPKHEL